jgi:hypothetical protein
MTWPDVFQRPTIAESRSLPGAESDISFSLLAGGRAGPG